MPAHEADGVGLGVGAAVAGGAALVVVVVGAVLLGVVVEDDGLGVLTGPDVGEGPAVVPAVHAPARSPTSPAARHTEAVGWA